jgi:hypothetical protein
MLRITVELLPGGSEHGRRILAHAEIARVTSGALSDYRVRLFEDVIGIVGAASLPNYPRLATTIWDLVGRGISVALTGKEELPERPSQLDVPVHESDDERPIPYVRFSEIPEPAQALFRQNMGMSTRPIIKSDPNPADCAYLWDWTEFLAGRR